MSEESSDKLSIRYEVTMEDLIDFNEYHILRSSSMADFRKRARLQNALLVGVVYFFFGLILLSLFPLILGLWFPPLIALTVGGIMYRIGFSPKAKWPKFMRNRVRRMYLGGENKVVIGEHELEVTETGITDSTIYNQNRYSWGALDRIETDRNCTYLYVSSNNAILVPHNNILQGDFPTLLRAIKTHYKPGDLLELTSTTSIVAPGTTSALEEAQSTALNNSQESSRVE